MAEFYQKIIFSPGLCGHFALGAFSKTYLKDVVFEINVFTKKNLKLNKIQKSQIWHQNQKSYHNQIILSQLRHIDTWFDKKCYKKCYAWSRRRLK